MNDKASANNSIRGRVALFLLSFLLAVGAWAFVAFMISPEATRVIRNVPVLTNEKDAAYKAYGLHIVDDTPYFIDVTVTGARSLISTLTSENIKITPAYSGVEQPGVYKLNLVASRVNSQQNFTIRSITETISLAFDAEAYKRFQVDARVDGVSADDGLMFGNVSVSPSEISINGSESEIDRIAKVVAQYNGEDEILTMSKEVIVDFILYDENGKVLSQDGLQLSSESAEITIPILMRGVLKIEIGFTNVPESFDISTLTYVISNSEIPIAADPGVIENIRPKLVGEVDLAKFEIGEEYKFEVILPSNIKNLDGVETVTVTFPKENLATKRVRVTEFRLDNAPANYDIEVMTNLINSVTVIGPQDELDLLLDTSVVAVIDLTSMSSIEKGEWDMAVRFRISGSKSLWVAGIYHAQIMITPN
ncbi:MAG: CdaR family protein [Oscillospiraceae bacterium]|nr:CdaR family protein [Oscillospiraceae bacterium]